jgi:hypothetical protein
MSGYEPPVIWATFYRDRSGLVLFDSEIAALRYAVEHDMKCQRIELGAEVWERLL